LFDYIRLIAMLVSSGY